MRRYSCTMQVLCCNIFIFIILTLHTNHISNYYIILHERFWRNIRSLERDSDRIAKELDIRAELRNWDNEFPYFHHEMVVRYIAGFMASAVAVAAWGQLRSLFSTKRR